ncbi:hypothetical protein GLW08_08390 [Pontibacillus yanchengensis]|uniref:Uncharacterized protein n=1 Tax=Pontibacillus yanchengensis TaxID=462910 RepID=A0ACC7VFG9_9BACI|nr:hypothetical protein [Pontibacillus yanchengensis]MYL53355.1 hypothetical protein [Pontibacillus yanchengensis]
MVEINLLEEKEKRNMVPLLILLLAIVLLSSSMLYLYTTQQSLKQEQQEIEQQISMVQNEQKILQQSKQDEKQVARENLQEKVGYVQSTIFPSVDFLQRLIELLPEEGYFLTYSYEDAGDISIDVQFDSMQEIAKYTNALEHETYLEELLVSMDTESKEEEQSSTNLLPRYIANYSFVVDEEVWEKELDENED